jgi:hypothetical protein
MIHVIKNGIHLEFCGNRRKYSAITAGFSNKTIYRLRVSWKNDIHGGDPRSFKYGLIPTISAQFVQQSENEAMMMIKGYQKI